MKLPVVSDHKSALVVFWQRPVGACGLVQLETASPAPTSDSGNSAQHFGNIRSIVARYMLVR